MTLPDGRVDPADRDEVAAVVRGVLTAIGSAGLGDLLARLPGTTRQAAVPKGFLRAAVPERVLLGQQDVIEIGEGVVHLQVVGGVTLHRSALAPGEAPAVIAGLIARLTATMGSVEDTAAVLTAAKETTDRF